MPIQMLFVCSLIIRRITYPAILALHSFGIKNSFNHCFLTPGNKKISMFFSLVKIEETTAYNKFLKSVILKILRIGLLNKIQFLDLFLLAVNTSLSHQIPNFKHQVLIYFIRHLIVTTTWSILNWTTIGMYCKILNLFH